jgi:hypothetical protein
MSLPTTRWEGTLTALSSVSHASDTRGTITLLRRELITQPDGHLVHIPIVSGNTLRGRLRRVGEELLRDVVGYEGKLHPAAAHALRGGGALAKTAHEPLSGSRLARLRELVPQIGVFGAAGGGTIIDGALAVGKVVPHVVETNHITGARAELSAFSATQIETYTRQDDAGSHDFTAVPAGELLAFDDAGAPRPAPRAGAAQQMLFNVETFPIGTVFSTWLRLHRPTALELAFFLDVLATFARDPRLGGRGAIGHGQVRVDLSCSPAPDTGALPDWREVTAGRAGAVLDVLGTLT